MTKDTRASSRQRPVLLLTLFVMLSALLHGAIGSAIARSANAAPGPNAPTTPVTLRLSFVGDILLASTVGKLIDTEGPLAPWLGVRDLLSSADLTVGNLESAVGTTGAPAAGKEYTFRADPKALQGLVDSGFDVVSLANNHTLDFGVDCFLEGIAALENADIEVIGAGANEAEARDRKSTRLNSSHH